MFLLLAISSSVFSAQKKIYLVASVSNDFVSNIIFDSINSELDIELEYIHFDSFSDALESVKSGYADFMLNVTHTKEREKWFEFSEPTNIEFMFVYSKGGNINFKQVQNLGVLKGTIYEKVLPTKYKKVNFITYDGIEEAKQLLINKKIDGFIGSISYLQSMIGLGYEAHVMRGRDFSHPVSVIAPKGKNKEILQKIQTYLLSSEFQQYFKNEVSNYQRLMRKQGLRKAVIKSNLNLYRPLQVGLKADTGQFVRFYRDGSVKGIAADIIYESCYILQMECEIVKGGSNRIRESGEKQSVDIFGPVEFGYAKERNANLSNVFYKQNTIFIKRIGYKNNIFDSFSQLFSEKIGAIKNSHHKYLLDIMYPGKDIATYSSYSELISGLNNGEIDYAYINRSALNHIHANSKKAIQIEEDTTLGTVFSYDLAFSFSDTEEGKLLAEFFSDAIELIDITSIVEKYDVPPDWYETLRWERLFRRVSYIGFFSITLLLLWAMYFFYSKSLTDDLTHLGNRFSLYNRYGKSFNRAYSLVYLDVNKFKHINDSYGHNMGDKALLAIAETIRLHWKGKGYRIGGDEFVLVYKGSPEHIEEMLQSFSDIYIDVDDSAAEHHVTLSVGVVYPREKNQPIEQVLMDADERMYRSKSRSREMSR